MSLDALIHRKASLFIDGAFREAPGGRPLAVVDPSTGAAFAEIAAGGAAEVAAATGAAAAAFPGWAATDGATRAGYLRAFAAGLRARAPDLVALQMLNNGKPRMEAEIDLGDAAATFDYYAGLGEDLDRRQDTPVPLPDPAYAGRTRFEPMGPVGMIVPWNFPLVTSAWKIAPALAAGCTVALKTSEFTPLAELAYGDIALEAGLPPGVLNLLTGAAEAGAALAADRRLRKLSFTGSNAVGARVMAAAAARCLPVSLELGGKSPIVVFADADLDHAIDCIAGGVFYNAGQMCSATSRLIVEESVAPALLDRLAARARALAVGPPETGADMGPITTRAQYDKVARYLERARAEGLDLVAGGETLAGDGFLVAPTVYADVPEASFLWREEIFGPVLATRTFRDEAEAIRLANDTDYGLVATIVTADPIRADRVAARMEAGHVWINSLQAIFPNTAWGGFKASGIGRELGPWGLSAYYGVKHVTAATQPPG
ncbi:aldehyde dehydrogenase family protein [Amaricoccus sp.]|uniref:aldehyde dehydrogenase family protein n=1 Tax=Amaricoccus sp. TaxID=1872485 RepID=UPI001B470919|nr:aldehyde dehydrogenase family protein [Amaricoccus sp.]MBP7001020.1 aldehyde dehydrogenase family protein [Amaricoccus sp.]